MNAAVHVATRHAHAHLDSSTLFASSRAAWHAMCQLPGCVPIPQSRATQQPPCKWHQHARQQLAPTPLHFFLQVNNLREIQALRRLSPHPHIIKLLEVLYDQPTGRLALVFELMVRRGA